jgi:hypothetical protein
MEICLSISGAIRELEVACLVWQEHTAHYMLQQCLRINRHIKATFKIISFQHILSTFKSTNTNMSTGSLKVVQHKPSSAAAPCI